MGIYFVADKHYIEDMMHWSQNAWSEITRNTHHGSIMLLTYRMVPINDLFPCHFGSWQDEPVYHSDRERCGPRQECSESQLDWTAEWYVVC